MNDPKRPNEPPIFPRLTFNIYGGCSYGGGGVSRYEYDGTQYVRGRGVSRRGKTFTDDEPWDWDANDHGTYDGGD